MDAVPGFPSRERERLRDWRYSQKAKVSAPDSVCQTRQATLAPWLGMIATLAGAGNELMEGPCATVHACFKTNMPRTRNKKISVSLQFLRKEYSS